MNFESVETYILISLLIPLIAGFNSFVVRHANLRDSLNVLISIAGFVNITKIYEIFKTTPDLLQINLVEILPNINLGFKIEPLGMIFALIVSFLWVVSTLYSIGYMRANNEPKHGKFFSFFSLAIFAALGIAFSSNLITLFLFYEFMTVCTFPLVTHSGTKDAKKSGRVYLGILMGTSFMFLLPAILITYFSSGTVYFTNGGILDGKVSVLTASILLLLFMYGIGKAALMPMHKWLPAAMVAPTPVSALLHAVAVVKAGVFCVVKIILYVFGADFLKNMMGMEWYNGMWLVYISGFTILAASVVAIFQDNLKKRLAYSTVSQLSYVVMAAAVLAPKSITAAAFHIAAHAFGKITLFFAAGSIYTASGKKYVSELGGLGHKMPWTFAAFSVAALSMIGVPPAVGFLSKYYMVVGAFSVQLYFVIGVLIASTLLNAGYFLPIIYKAFFEREKISNDSNAKEHGEAPFLIVIALTITAIMTIGLFIYPDIFMNLAKDLVK